MEWLLKKYMAKVHIDSFSELSKVTGIKYRTLLNHIKDGSQWRLFELMALDEVLKFTDDDLLKIARGATDEE